MDGRCSSRAGGAYSLVVSTIKHFHFETEHLSYLKYPRNPSYDKRPPTFEGIINVIHTTIAIVLVQPFSMVLKQDSEEGPTFGRSSCRRWRGVRGKSGFVFSRRTRKIANNNETVLGVGIG